MPDYRAADGVRLHYTDEGDGLPLVCLPGLTREGTDFDFVAPHLTGVRLIRPDYRGRGRSDRADPATYTVPHEAQEVLALLDHLGLGTVALLGTSRGGLIAMALAVTAKDRLAGVALNDIGPVVEETGLEFIKTYLGRNPVSRTHDEAAAARSILGDSSVAYLVRRIDDPEAEANFGRTVQSGFERLERIDGEVEIWRRKKLQ